MLREADNYNTEHSSL